MKMTASVKTEKAESGLKEQSGARQFTVICDEPAESGGTDAGMNSVELELANLRGNPRMAVSVWDETHGYQVKGTVTYEDEGEHYEAIAPRCTRSSPAWDTISTPKACAGCMWKRSIPSRPDRMPARDLPRQTRFNLPFPVRHGQVSA